MNAEFEQWVKDNFTQQYQVVIGAAYQKLQSNPHLLKEDGEKEPDWQGEAERIILKHCNTVAEFNNTSYYPFPFFKVRQEELAALTEALQKGYERGRCLTYDFYDAQYNEIISELQNDKIALEQQLAEKVKDKNVLSECFRLSQSELTAAKAEINKLQQQKADLELALKNL